MPIITLLVRVTLLKSVRYVGDDFPIPSQQHCGIRAMNHDRGAQIAHFL